METSVAICRQGRSTWEVRIGDGGLEITFSEERVEAMEFINSVTETA